MSDPRHLAFSLGQAGPHDPRPQRLAAVHVGGAGEHLPLEATFGEPVAHHDLRGRDRRGASVRLLGRRGLGWRLQWHHMLTRAGYPADNVPNLRLNTLFDGIFHAATWIAVAIGLVVLHRAIRRGYPWSGNRLIGGMAIGWGAFNLVEGAVDHHLLGLHHVKENAANPMIGTWGSSHSARCLWLWASR